MYSEVRVLQLSLIRSIVTALVCRPEGGPEPARALSKSATVPLTIEIERKVHHYACFLVTETNASRIRALGYCSGDSRCSGY